MVWPSWGGSGLTAQTLTTSVAGSGDTAFTSIAGGTNIAVVESGVSGAPAVQMLGQANIYCGWNSTILGTLTRYTVKTIFYASSIPTASWTICSGSIGSTVQWRLDISGSASSPAQVLRLRNGSAQVAASTQTLTSGVEYLLEVQAHDGQITVCVYNASDSSIASGPITGTATSTEADTIRFGNFSSSTTVPTMLYDAMMVDEYVELIAVDGSAEGTSDVAATIGNDVEPLGLNAASVSGGGLTATVGVWGADAQPAIPGEMQLWVLIRDTDFGIVGAVTPSALTFTSRFNDVGEWKIALPADMAAAVELRKPGAGILIYNLDAPTDPLMSGPVAQRSIKTTSDGLELEVSGPDDMAWIASRLAYQSPSDPASEQHQAGAVFDRRTGTAEEVIKGFVDANVGQTALTNRRRLTVAPLAATPRGATVAGRARMSPLLDLIKPLAEVGGLGYRVKQQGNTLIFDVFEPTDKTGHIRFSLPLGNLDDFTLTETAPQTSAIIVGGEGEGTARVFTEQSNSPALTLWPGFRVEKYVDQASGTSAEVQQAKTEELVNGGPNTSLTLATRDTASMRFGVDYFVGDLVTVEPPLGIAPIHEVLREVTLTWGADDGVSAVTRVGSAETTGTPKLIRALRKLNSKTVNTSNEVK